MKRRYGALASDSKFTAHEKRKLLIYIMMAIVGAFFFSSLRQYTDPLVDKYGGGYMLIGSLVVLGLLYYFLDMKKY